MDENRAAAGIERISDGIETWIFDLDNTLYPASCRLFDQVDRNITRYIIEHFGLGWDDAKRMQKTYFKEHGNTMRGLMILHGTDPSHYLDFVHDIDLSPVAADPNLDQALHRLDGRKVIFTNGSTRHAERVMKKLGVEHHFEGIFDIVDAECIPKPEPVVYAKLIEEYTIEPTRSVMIEDMARNLVPAAAMGMTTVWVRTDSAWGQDGSEGEHIDHVIDDLAGWLTDLTQL